MCEKKPALKAKLGCHGGATWSYPPTSGRYTLDRCPLRYITPDITALFVAVTLSDGRMSLTEQRQSPARYTEAFMLAAIERKAAIAWKAARAKHG